MVVLLVFSAVALLYGFSDLKADVKARNWKPAAIYAISMSLAIALCFCVQRNVNLKSPSEIVTKIVKEFLPPLG